MKPCTPWPKHSTITVAGPYTVKPAQTCAVPGCRKSASVSPAAPLRRPQDREDRPDRDVDVDVRRAIQRVQQHQIVAGRAGHLVRAVEFLGGDAGHRAGPGQRLQEGVVGQHVELFLRLAGGVGGFGRAQHAGQGTARERRRNLPAGGADLLHHGDQGGIQMPGTGGQGEVLKQGNALAHGTVLGLCERRRKCRVRIADQPQHRPAARADNLRPIKRRQRMSTHVPVTVFFNFRSPYCYLASKSMFDILDRFDCHFEWRPLGGWDGRSSPERAKGKLPIARQDVRRWCRRLGIPFNPPPVTTDPTRAGAGSLLAEQQGRLREYVMEVMHAEWGEGRDIGDIDVLRGRRPAGRPRPGRARPRGRRRPGPAGAPGRALAAGAGGRRVRRAQLRGRRGGFLGQRPAGFSGRASGRSWGRAGAALRAPAERRDVGAAPSQRMSVQGSAEGGLLKLFRSTTHEAGETHGTCQRQGRFHHRRGIGHGPRARAAPGQ